MIEAIQNEEDGYIKAACAHGLMVCSDASLVPLLTALNDENPKVKIPNSFRPALSHMSSHVFLESIYKKDFQIIIIIIIKIICPFGVS